MNASDAAAAGGISEPAAEPPMRAGAADSQVPATAATAARGRLGAGLRISIYGIFALSLLAALFFARSLLLPILVAILLTLLLTPPVNGLVRIGLPRPLAAFAVVAAVVTLVGFLGSYLYAPAQQWVDAGPDQMAELREKFRMLRAPVEAVQNATEKVAEAAAPAGSAAPREVVVERQPLLDVMNGTHALFVGALATLILLYFLLSSGDLFLRKLIRVIPRFGDKVLAVEISRTIQHQIARYFAAVTMINTGLGLIVWLAMMALGMPTPALLGAIAGLLNFIPYIGSAITLAVLTLVGVLTFDTAGQMLAPVAVYAVLTTLEGQVVQPIVLGARLNSTPVVLFAWVLFWGWLWGIGGVAVAVPMLVAVKICADHIPGWETLAEFLGREVERPAR